jgi:hypothetical protein
MSSIGVISTPGVSRGTRNAVTPGPLRAKTRNNPARRPPVIQVFVPFRTQPPPARRALVVIRVASLPTSGSETHNEAGIRPDASDGSHCRR